MKVSTFPAILIMAVIVFAVLAISNQITDGEPKLVPSAVTGIVVGAMNAIWFKVVVKRSDASEPE